jgi:hypothetical protein
MIGVVCGSRIVNFFIGARRTDAQDESATGSGQGSNAEHWFGQRRCSTCRASYSRTTRSLSRASRPEAREHRGSRRWRAPPAYRPDLSPHRHLRHLSRSPSPSSSAGRLQEQQKQQLIFGQGATGKTRAEAGLLARGGEEAGRLLAAFGAENHESE